MIDDEKIIELFFERSEQAIRELDIKYGKICHNLSYNIVNSRQDAEECVNDAYLGAWNAIPPVRPNPLLSYIVKIVRNISLKIYWRKEAAKRSGHYTIALEEIEGCIADQKTVEDEIEARELARIIEAFLDTLTVKERVIFMRRYAYADTYQNRKAAVDRASDNRPRSAFPGKRLHEQERHENMLSAPASGLLHFPAYPQRCAPARRDCNAAAYTVQTR